MVLSAIAQATGPADALVTGKNAKNLTEVEACRIDARNRRKQWARNSAPMSAAELQRWSRQRRRGRQTKPGKRRKR